MTSDQFLLVLRFYQHVLTGKDELGGIDIPQEALHDIAPTTGEQLRHLLSMLTRMEEMSGDDPETAMRWLGFMQGTLWALGIYTIDELRVHNTSPDLMRHAGLC